MKIVWKKKKKKNQSVFLVFLSSLFLLLTLLRLSWQRDIVVWNNFFFLAWPSRYLWRKAVTIINLFCNFPMMSIPILDFLYLFWNNYVAAFFFFSILVYFSCYTRPIIYLYSQYKPLKMVLSGLYVPCRFTQNCIVNINSF